MGESNLKTGCQVPVNKHQLMGPLGRVPTNQSLVYAFNAVEEDRILQDVGLDGLSDEEEAAIFTNGPANDRLEIITSIFFKLKGES